MAEHRIPQQTRGEELTIESFTTPDTFYSVHLYRDENGVVIGGSCDCPARVAPLEDKHVLLKIAEEYGEHSPRTGGFVTSEFLDELAEITGIARWELSDALIGERRVAAKAVLRAAVAMDRDGDPESWGRFVRGWGKRHRRGWHHPTMRFDPEEVA